MDGQVGGYNIIAVNENEAQNMKTALTSYRDNFAAILNKIIAIEEQAYKVGFQGAQVNTIKSYIDRSVEEMKKMDKFLLEFDAGIDKVLANYAAQSASISTAEVEEASVSGEGDLTGVNEFNQ